MKSKEMNFNDVPPELMAAVEAGPGSTDPEFDILTAKEAAKILKVHSSTIYKMMLTNQIKVVRWGKCVRVTRAELYRFIQANTV